jgi:hypothetical protein
VAVRHLSRRESKLVVVLRSQSRRSEAIGSDCTDPAHRAVSQFSGEAASQVDCALPCLAEGKFEAIGLEVRAERPLTRPQKQDVSSHRRTVVGDGIRAGVRSPAGDEHRREPEACGAAGDEERLLPKPRLDNGLHDSGRGGACLRWSSTRAATRTDASWSRRPGFEPVKGFKTPVQTRNPSFDTLHPDGVQQQPDQRRHGKIGHRAGFGSPP